VSLGIEIRTAATLLPAGGQRDRQPEPSGRL